MKLNEKIRRKKVGLTQEQVTNSSFLRSKLGWFIYKRSAILCGIDLEWKSGRRHANRNATFHS